MEAEVAVQLPWLMVELKQLVPPTSAGAHAEELTVGLSLNSVLGACFLVRGDFLTWEKGHSRREPVLTGFGRESIPDFWLPCPAV